jgi:hypothetical protein
METKGGVVALPTGAMATNGGAVAACEDAASEQRHVKRGRFAPS